MKLYDALGLGDAFVVEDRDGKLWIVPIGADGWDRRTEYKGYREALHAIEGGFRLTWLGVPTEED